MASTVKWGIETNELTEEEGIVVHYTTTFRAEGLNNTYADYRTLEEALNASGMPQQGDAAPGNTNMRMYRRTVQPIPGMPNECRVVCEYKPLADWEDSFTLSIGTGLNSVQTNTDINGNLITLAYTYPNTYPIEELRNETLSTVANESVFEPRVTLTGTGTLYVYFPLAVVQSWLWHVNATAWRGWPAGYWLCTACDATPRDIGPGRAPAWRFRWTFELNVRGWNVVSKIIDPNTGLTPPDVVLGVGVKDVLWYASRSFSYPFGI